MQIRNLQYLRGIAAIAVVLYHIHLWESKALGGYAAVPKCFGIGDAGVDLFFVISGFIMVFIQSVRIDSMSSYARFLSHRITRVYPPLWVVSLLLLPIWLVCPKLFNNFYDNHVDIWRSFLLVPQNYTPLLGVAWTLIHEIYFYLVVSLALLLPKHGRWIFGGVWFTLVFAVFHRFGDTHFADIRILQLIFSPFSLIFLLGYFVGLGYSRIRKCSPYILVGVFVFGVAGLMVGYSLHLPVGVYPNNNHLFRFFAYGLPCGCLVLSAVGLDASIRRNFQVLKVLGDASYAIYLTHLPLVSGFYAALKSLHPQNVFILAISALVCLIGCLLAAVAFHRNIERHITRACRNLIERMLPEPTPRHKMELTGSACLADGCKPVD